MTARVTTLKGPAAGAYYVEQLPNYYLDSGEPRGVWHGRGAELLGLYGEVDNDAFLALLTGADPNQPEVLLGRRFGDTSVRGFDITASAPKSVSTLFAVGDDRVRDHVLAAHDAAVAAMVDWVERHAHTRFRVNGEIVTVDAKGIVAATFRQHTSRALDPQLHTHVVVANRVYSPDGRWLALDARTLKLDQRTASATYHLALRSELTRRLGVEWGPVVNGIADVEHLPDVVLEEFSSRTADIVRRLDEKLDRFTQTMDREPTVRERWQLEREAAIDSRPSKPHEVSADVLHRRWRDQVIELGIHPTRMTDLTLDAVLPRELTKAVGEKAIDQAMQTLSEKQSTWRPAELQREIAAAIPTDVALSTGQLGATLDYLTTLAIDTRCVDISRPIPNNTPLRRDGRPITEAGIDRALTTDAILAQEHRLNAWADRRMAHPAIDSPVAAGRARVELTGPQAEVAATVAGNAHLALVVGPAGTGKTTALTPGVEQLHAEGRAVFGVAPSAAAAEVLGRETGVDADTIDKLLTEHDLTRPPAHRYDLPAGATIIVDEAGMLATDKLDQLAYLADTRSWRIVMVGDPMQFSAVGRGGMFEHLIDQHGAIELDRVHRFTHHWERDASLHLRRSTPGIAEIYDLHGRLHGGDRLGMQRAALDAWHQARVNGETVILAAPTNDVVVRLNEQAQQRLLQTGELSDRGRSIQTGPYRLHAGDEIATRRNHRQLETDRGIAVRNRDHWTIDTVHRNRDLTVTGKSGTIRLPADYVQQHVELGYAQTSHATQGATVDRSILYLDGPTDARGIYVPLTRGRHDNTAYIVADPQQTAVEVITDGLQRNWIDRPATVRQAELNPVAAAQRPGTLPPSELRQLIALRAEIESRLTETADDLENLPIQRLHLVHDRYNTINRLADQQARYDDAAQLLADRDRLLRRRGHEIEIAHAKRTIDTLPPHIATNVAAIERYNTQIGVLDQQYAHAARQDRDRPRLQAELDETVERLQQDQAIRSRVMRLQQPEHITNTLGHRPIGGQPANTWALAAGQLDQHHAAFRLTHGLGPQRGLRMIPGFQHSRALTTKRIDAISQSIAHQQRELRQQELSRSRGLGRSR